MPPFRVAAAALRETTERIAAEVVRPSASTPQWSELYWTIAQAAAAIHGVSALLHARSQWRGPASWRSFLDAQRLHSTLRERRIRELLKKIDAAASDAGIPVIAMKGSALHSLNIYDVGERPMADVDLLVRTSDLNAVSQALGTLRYRLVYPGVRHAVYRPDSDSAIHGFGEHERNAVPIEVHTVVYENMPVHRIDITDSLWPRDLRDGINPYASDAALMLNLLLHVSGNIRKRAVRQIQLHDIALLARRMNREQWHEALSNLDKNEPRWWLYPPLELTRRYYPDSIPADVIGAAKERCPAFLRILSRQTRLTGISFSNPRIPAFPGIGWSRTPLEALRLMRTRIAPDRAALDDMRISVDAYPRLKQLPWFQLSQLERIVRWVFRRAPRVQTLLSLRDALDQTSARARTDA